MTATAENETQILPPNDGICPKCGKYRGVNRVQWTLYPDWYSCKYCFRSGMPNKDQRDKFVEEQRAKVREVEGDRRDIVAVKVDSVIATLNTLKEVFTGVRIELVEVREHVASLSAEVNRLSEALKAESESFLDQEDLETILNQPPMEQLKQESFMKDWVNRRLLIEPGQLPRKWKEKRGRPLVGSEIRARGNTEMLLANELWASFLDPVYYLFPKTVLNLCASTWEALDNDQTKKDRFVSQLSSRLALSPGSHDDKIMEAQQYASPTFIQLAASYLSAPLTLTAQDKEELGW